MARFMDVRDELIRITGLEQLPKESAGDFAERLHKAVPPAKRDGLSGMTVAWLEMGDAIDKAKLPSAMAGRKRRS